MRGNNKDKVRRHSDSGWEKRYPLKCSLSFLYIFFRSFYPRAVHHCNLLGCKQRLQTAGLFCELLTVGCSGVVLCVRGDGVGLADPCEVSECRQRLLSGPASRSRGSYIFKGTLLTQIPPRSLLYLLSLTLTRHVSFFFSYHASRHSLTLLFMTIQIFLLQLTLTIRVILEKMIVLQMTKEFIAFKES